MRRNNEQGIICNKCGRKIKMHNEVPVEDVFHAQKVWGYFSSKDGIRHSWDLCESCYEEMIRGFVIPPEETDATEFI